MATALFEAALDPLAIPGPLANLAVLLDKFVLIDFDNNGLHVLFILFDSKNGFFMFNEPFGFLGDIMICKLLDDFIGINGMVIGLPFFFIVDVQL
jgi:hypothetical protein